MKEESQIKKEGFAARTGEPCKPSTSANMSIDISKQKGFSPNNNDIAEKSYTTEPALRIRRGHNITIRRCYMIANFLKGMGFDQDFKLTRKDLENAVSRVPGMDHRTINRYIGFDVLSKGKEKSIVKHIAGYLERLRIIERCGNGFWFLSLLGVPDETEHTIPNLCVFETEVVREERQLTAAIDIRLSTTTTTNTHTNQLGESNQNRVARELSPLEQAVLNAEPCEDKDRAKIVWPSQPFKPRFEEPFNPNLSHAKPLRREP